MDPDTDNALPPRSIFSPLKMDCRVKPGDGASRRASRPGLTH
jgi:hypothetical protein